MTNERSEIDEPKNEVKKEAEKKPTDITEEAVVTAGLSVADKLSGAHFMNLKLMS